MKTVRDIMGRLEEAVSASVQTSEPYMTYTQDGDRINYTIWAWVSPYFGEKPAARGSAIYIHMRGRTEDSLEDLIARQRVTYGAGGSLMAFRGKEEEYPYTKGRYTGDTIDDIEKIEKAGGKTVRLRDGKIAPIA